MTRLLLVLALVVPLAGCADAAESRLRELEREVLSVGAPDGVVDRGLDSGVDGPFWNPRPRLTAWFEYPAGVDAAEVARGMAALHEEAGWTVGRVSNETASFDARRDAFAAACDVEPAVEGRQRMECRYVLA